MSRIRKLIAVLAIVAILAGTTAVFAETVTPAGNTYGFAGTNGKYYTDYPSFADEQQAARKLAIEAASEGFTLLKNENNALPLDSGAYVTLFGMRSVDLVASTVGSAAGSTGANGLEESTLRMAMEEAGYKVNSKLIDLYTKHLALGTTAEELPMEYYSNAVISTYNGYHDAAILVFSRTGSEGVDKAACNVPGHSNPADHEMMLTDNEKALVKHVKEYYKETPIIVLVNSSNILQIPELAEPKATSEYGVDAIFWVGNTGNNAIEAIGKLISGEVNPSGHTVEVWEKDFTQGPTWTNFAHQTQNGTDAFYYTEDGEQTIYATVEYREGIYMGYKYYETRYDDAPEAEKAAAYDNVLYPFGYGLSYTSFDWELVPSAENTITDYWQKMSIQVKVTYTGKVAGKGVVQIYANPPYTKGGIEKASANLVAFAKTDLLEPGESQVLTMDWVAQDMASFDWNDANGNDFIGYELEAGAYEITARRNSHDVVLSETYTVSSGIQCTHDYTTGNEITALFVDDWTTVNDSLLDNMISRSTGLVQPGVSSVEDRTIDAEYKELIDNQYTYRSYMDQGYEDWFVEEDGIPETWMQAAERNEGDRAEIQIQDMIGIDFNLTISDGAVHQGDDEGSKKWEAFMNQFTWEELANFVRNGGGVTAAPFAGIEGAGADETPLQLAGGTMWACPPILAASFNVKLAERVGVMMGNEALYKGCSYWQGNAMNTHRSPLSGRNVEYYSQDGVHGAAFAAAIAKGVTSKGVTCEIKHMMLNDQESYRDRNGGVFTWAPEQVIRELYAKPFEAALKEGNATGVMGSFNRLGNINSQLNPAVKALVRDEWDNRAIFETDAWQGTYCPIDLMVRQGNTQILGSGSTLPVVDLEVGTWSADDHCVLVSDGGDGTFASQTHYAAVRRNAQEMLWNYCNGNAIKNGYTAIDDAILTFDAYVVQSLPVNFDGIDFNEVALAEGAELPAGFTLEGGVITADGSQSICEFSVPVVLSGIDGYLNMTANVSVKVIDPIHVSESTLKVGQAADITINAPSYGYNSLITLTGAYNCTLAHVDGTPIEGVDANLWGMPFRAPGTGEPVADQLNIMNWYWVDESLPYGVTGYDSIGAIPFPNATCTDARVIEIADIEAGNYYQAYEYGFAVSDEDAAKLAEYGLTLDKVMVDSGYKYDVNTALSISGTASKAGTVEIGVTLTVPLVRGFGSAFPNNVKVVSPCVIQISTAITLTIAE